MEDIHEIVLPTQRQMEVWTMFHINGLSAKAIAAKLGITPNTVYQLCAKYQSRVELPSNYIETMRARAKAIAPVALDKIEDNLQSDKPDMHLAVQLLKGTGVLVERTEMDVRVQEIAYDPEQAKLDAIAAIYKRRAESVNPDSDAPPSPSNTLPSENPSTES